MQIRVWKLGSSPSVDHLNKFKAYFQNWDGVSDLDIPWDSWVDVLVVEVPPNVAGIDIVEPHKQ